MISSRYTILDYIIIILHYSLIELLLCTCDFILLCQPVLMREVFLFTPEITRKVNTRKQTVFFLPSVAATANFIRIDLTRAFKKIFSFVFKCQHYLFIVYQVSSLAS